MDQQDDHICEAEFSVASIRILAAVMALTLLSAPVALFAAMLAQADPATPVVYEPVEIPSVYDHSQDSVEQGLRNGRLP